jgi:uncharacterized protein (DUF1697 family)
MRQLLLLRGINVGAHNRIKMPALRERLTEAGFADVRTYVQSGNILVSSDAPSDQLARDCERHIADSFGLSIDVLARTRDELAEVVRRNPLAEVAVDPKRYQVSFCSPEPDSELLERLAVLASASERFVAIGRELYAWHPDGIARSRLWAKLGSGRLGVTATARNWSTVTTLLEMADA